MTLHNVKTLSTSIRAAMAAALMLTSVSGFSAALPEKDFVTQPVGHGVYELAYDGQAKVLFAASAPSFDKDQTKGKIYKLNLEDLTGTGVIETTRRAFATALDEENHLLYVGNTLEGSVTVIDTRTGKELAVIQLADTSNPKDIAHTREMVLDKQHHRLYVTAVVEKGIVWVIDTEKRQLINTLTDMGEYPTGLAVDAEKNRLYVVNGKNGLIVVDTQTDKIVSRFNVEPEKKHFFLNIALDSKNNRAFLTDPDLPKVLGVDIRTGKVLHHIDVTNSLAVLYNEKRNEIYVTHRNGKLISIIDSQTYKVKNSIATTAMPNSLALSTDGNVLYASVKQDEKVAKEKPDYVIRIALDKL